MLKALKVKQRLKYQHKTCDLEIFVRCESRSEIAWELNLRFILTRTKAKEIYVNTAKLSS